MADSTGTMRRVDWLYALLLAVIAGMAVASWQSGRAESAEARKEFKEELAKSRESGERAAKELGEKVTAVQVTVAGMGAKFDALVDRDLVSRSEYDAMKSDYERRLAHIERKLEGGK